MGEDAPRRYRPISVRHLQRFREAIPKAMRAAAGKPAIHYAMELGKLGFPDYHACRWAELEWMLAEEWVQYARVWTASGEPTMVSAIKRAHAEALKHRDNARLLWDARRSGCITDHHVARAVAPHLLPLHGVAS